MRGLQNRLPCATVLAVLSATGPTQGAASGTLQLPVESQAPSSQGERYRVEPVRVDEGPRLDGVLDEEVWAVAAVIDEFVQQEPADGAPASELTIVRMLYDEQVLYIGLEAFDSDPNGVITTEMRRDSPRLFDEDNFQIILDTFQDSRSGYMFVTSPLGGKLEQQITEEGEGGCKTRGPTSTSTGTACGT